MDSLCHFLNFNRPQLLFSLQFKDLLFLFKFTHSALQNLILLSLFLDLVVQPQRLISEDGHLLLQVLDPIVSGKHLFLLLGFVLDFSEFLLDLVDMVSVGAEELRLVFLQHMLDFLIHLVYCPVEISVGIKDWVGVVRCKEEGL